MKEIYVGKLKWKVSKKLFALVQQFCRFLQWKEKKVFFFRKILSAKREEISILILASCEFKKCFIEVDQEIKVREWKRWKLKKNGEGRKKINKHFLWFNLNCRRVSSLKKNESYDWKRDFFSSWVQTRMDTIHNNLWVPSRQFMTWPAFVSHILNSYSIPSPYISQWNACPNIELAI